MRNRILIFFSILFSFTSSFIYSQEIKFVSKRSEIIVNENNEIVISSKDRYNDRWDIAFSYRDSIGVYSINFMPEYGYSFYLDIGESVNESINTINELIKWFGLINDEKCEEEYLELTNKNDESIVYKIYKWIDKEDKNDKYFIINVWIGGDSSYGEISINDLERIKFILNKVYGE